MPTTRIKRTETRIPQTLEEVDAFVGLVGQSQCQIDLLEAKAEDEIRRIREELRKASERFRKNRNTLMTGVFAFAQAHKAVLTKDGKTVHLTNGSISWRWTPPAVSTKDDEALINWLKSHGMEGYVRLKEELNREYLLEDRTVLQDVPGLAFTQREEFVVKPARSKEVAKTRTITCE